MLITMFFIIASIGLIVFTVVYSKKKKQFYNLVTNEKVKSRQMKKNIKTIWGIDNIKNGIITVNSKHSIIIELGSIEYKLLNEEEQNNIDSSLIKLAKTFNFQTQFFSTIEKIDTTNKIEEIEKNLDKQKNSKMREYGESIIEYLANIMQEENLYVRKNYLIITSNQSLEKAEMELKETFNNIQYQLYNIRVMTKMLSDEDILELIYRELNKNSNMKIDNIMKKGGLDFYVKARSQEKREENSV